MDTRQAIVHGGHDLAKLKDLADAEASDNSLDFARRKGDALTYGQAVQLRHVASGRFVQISLDTTSRREPSHQRVLLTDYVSRSSWFRIMPRFKVRSEGEPVLVGDMV